MDVLAEQIDTGHSWLLLLFRYNIRAYLSISDVSGGKCYIYPSLSHGTCLVSRLDPGNLPFTTAAHEVLGGNGPNTRDCSKKKRIEERHDVM